MPCGLSRRSNSIRWPAKYQILVGFLCLLIPEFLYRFTHIPNFDQPFTDQHNFGNYMDMVLMGRINDGGWVAINCISTSAHTIWGVLAGQLLLSDKPARDKMRYLIGSGVVLLFAGTRVWRRAWFPLGLLLLSQPVPVLTSSVIDIPLQNISARVARSFATLIHFAPTTPQLRLMFSPDFGMFIAPGCDGIRGAVTLGYLALILGYLKRVSLRRWAAYVVGGVLLGYFFNFIRLCVLVVYYRVALGHPTLEGVAKQADYAIGSCLFLIAILIFIWLAGLKAGEAAPSDLARAGDEPQPSREKLGQPVKSLFIRLAAFAVVLLAVLVLPSSALRARQSGPDSALSSPASLARFPKQIGQFALTRTWYEQSGGQTLVESGAYSQSGADEIILAIWVAPFVYYHDANSC